MDTRWIQGLSNGVSLITIIFFAKKMLIKPESEMKDNWPVIGLITSDTILAVANILIIGDAYAYENGRFFNLCRLQGFFIHVGMLASFMWLNIMTLIMYNRLYTRLEISQSRTVLVCYLLPFTYCLM